MTAKRIDYWTDLEEMPEEGPFVVCGGPIGASTPRIEQAPGPSGRGCPVALHKAMRSYMEEHKIPRGLAGASLLNEHYREGRFQWDGVSLVPKPPLSPSMTQALDRLARNERAVGHFSLDMNDRFERALASQGYVERVEEGRNIWRLTRLAKK